MSAFGGKAASLEVSCPLWVKSRHRGISNQCPLYPPKADMFLGWGPWLSGSSPFGSGLSCDGPGSGEVSVGFDDSMGGLFCGRGATLHLRFKTVARSAPPMLTP